MFYAPYLAREELEVKKNNQLKNLSIPEHFDATNLPGLSRELQQKLKKYKPATIAQAELIPGMTPAAISLLIYTIRYTLD
jgi:tRNA uridine 5-carboxymethylaminomethyl modification enzyme